MIEFNFRGLMAPVFTPFNDDATRSLNLDIIPDYANYLLNENITGILVSGTTGEGTSLNVSERKQIAEKWIKVCKKNKQTLMLQVGGAPLPDVLELARHAERIQADAILCLPELYFKPNTAEDLIRYLKLVSDAAPNTPLFYYHIPAVSKVEIYMPEFLKKAHGQINTLMGIKFTSPVLTEGIKCVKVCESKYVIFLGCDELLVAACASGFDSMICISLNTFPKIGKQIMQSLKTDIDLKFANQNQAILTSNIDSLSKHGGLIPAMKAAMNISSPIKVGPVREPLVELTNEQKNAIKNIFN